MEPHSTLRTSSLFNLYPTAPVTYQGMKYRCLADAQWACFFRCLGIDRKYHPIKFSIDWPGTERYRIGSGTKTVVYEPAMFLEGVGFWDVTQGEPDDETQLCATMLAEKLDEPVYIVHGAPRVPYTFRPDINAIVVCRRQEVPHGGRRMLHNGREFRVGLPTVEANVYASAIQAAATEAEMMAERYSA